MVVEASNRSNIHKVYIFLKNESISNMLENGAIDNPMLISVFDFVKNDSELEQHNLILYVFVIFYAWKQFFVVYESLMYFILVYRLAMLAKLVFRPKFVNLMDLIVSLRICQMIYMFRMCLFIHI